MLAPFKQFLRAHEVRKISTCLTGKNRISLKSHDLSPFDLGIPVGAFDKADHDASLPALGKKMKPVDHRPGIQMIGLHHHAESLPLGKCRLIHQRLNDIQSQIKAFALLGINVKTH